MVNKNSRRPSAIAKRAFALAALIALPFGVAVLWQQSKAQVAGTSSQGVASLTVLSTGATTNESGYTSGQDLQWVGTYQQLEFSSIAKQRHVLSFGNNEATPTAKPYVLGSTVAPPGYAREWNVGTDSVPSWIETEPTDGRSIRGVRYTYNPVVAPPLSSTISFSGTGDGYRVIPYSLPQSGVSSLFIVNHHSNEYFLKCINAADGSVCPNWGALQTDLYGKSSPTGGYHVSKVPGEAFQTNGLPAQVNRLWTPVKTTEYLDRNTGELYFPAGVATSGLQDVGFACANLRTKTSCGLTVTGKAWRGATIAGSPGNLISGLGTTGDKKMLMFQDGFGTSGGRSKIHCFNTVTKAACAGQPYEFDPTAGTAVSASEYETDKSSWWLSSFTVQNRTFIAYNSIKLDRTGFRTTLSCFDSSTNAACAGFENKTVSGTARHGVLPMLDTAGELTGVCATASTECYALDGTSVTVSATSALGKFLAYQPFYDGGVLQSYVVGKTQVYTFKDDLDAAPPYAIKQSRISCYDFATGDFCFQDISKLSTAPDIVTGPAAFYAVTEDPERPGCVWALGDKSRAAVWEAATGGPCVQRTVTYAVDTIPVNYYGFDKTINGDVEYRKVVIHGLDSSFVDSTNGVRVTVAAVDEHGAATATLVDNVQLATPSAGADYVLNLAQYATGTTALTPPLTYKNYPRLRTTITVYRAIGNPNWPTGVISDVIWSGPPVQFSVQTTAPTNATSSCNGESFVQSGIFVANTTNGTVTTSTRAVSNALLENLASSSTGPVMLTSSYLGYERTNPQSWEGTPTIAMYTMYDSNVFTGNIGFFDVTSGTAGAGTPTSAQVADIHGLAIAPADRKAYTSLSDGSTVSLLNWDNLDATAKDQLNRNRGGVIDGRGEDRLAYIRGDRSKEIGRSGSNGIFHARSDRGTTCSYPSAGARLCTYQSTSDNVPDPGTMSSSGLALLLPGRLSGYSEALAPGYSKSPEAPDIARTAPVVFANSNDGFLYAHKLVAGAATPSPTPSPTPTSTPTPEPTPASAEPASGAAAGAAAGSSTAGGAASVSTPGTLTVSEEFVYLPRRPMSLMSGYTDRSFSELGAFPYLNDGSPLLADFCRANCGSAADAQWRTALVSTFGRAFPGGYAVDVTDVAKSSETPVRSLWEFTDLTPVSNATAQPDPAQYLGKQSAFPLSSFSNASLSTQVVRVKVASTSTSASSGSTTTVATRWAWIIGNGYNSAASNSAGVTEDNATAVLYVVFMDEATSGNPQYVGLRLTGLTGAQNGLSTPNPVDVDGDGTVDLVYAGDLQGRMWRIDLSGLSLERGFPANAANVVMNSTNATGTLQPIVGAPAVVAIGNTSRMVVFSSGRPEITQSRYLDNGSQAFSLFGVKDDYLPGSASSTGWTATSPPSRSDCASRALGTEGTIAVSVKTGQTSTLERTAATRPITGAALTTQRCWALDLSSGETGIGNATHNPIGQVVDLLSIESPRGSTTGSGATAVHSCQPGRSWINRLNALTGLPTGFDTNADGFINGTEAAIGAVSVDRSTGQIINNGRNLTAGTGGSVGPTGPGSVSITPPNVGRIWWREL